MTTDGHMPTPGGPNDLFMRILKGVLIFVGSLLGLAVLGGLLLFGTCMLGM